MYETLSSITYVCMFAMGGACIISGILVYLRDPRNPILLLHFLMTIISSAWVISVALFQFGGVSVGALYYLLTIFIMCLIDAFFLFSYAFWKNRGPTLKEVLFNVTPLVLLIFAMLSTGRIVFPSYFSYEEIMIIVLLQIPFVPFQLFYSTSKAIGAALILYKKFQTSAGIFKQVSQITALIYVAAVGVGVVTYLFFPPLGLEEFLFVQPFFASLIICFNSFILILYYRMNLRIFLTEFFLIFVCVLLAGNIFLAHSYQEIAIRLSFFFINAAVAYFLYQNIKKESLSEERVQNLKKTLSLRNQQLTFSNHRNSAFISSTSNQLREPLSDIRWKSAALLTDKERAISESLREYIERIHDSSIRLLTIVDDFLNLRRIEQQEMEYAYKKFDIKKILQEVIMEIRPFAEKKGLALTYEANEENNFSLTADEGKIRQVISNLIDNAVKYTQKGGIKVNIVGKKNKIVLTITDTGLGINNEDIAKLFKKFARMEGGRKANAEGSGLGLYIAYEMVRAHGGNLYATSPGALKGSSFTMELPREPIKKG